MKIKAMCGGSLSREPCGDAGGLVSSTRSQKSYSKAVWVIMASSLTTSARNSTYVAHATQRSIGRGGNNLFCRVCWYWLPNGLQPSAASLLNRLAAHDALSDLLVFDQAQQLPPEEASHRYQLPEPSKFP